MTAGSATLPTDYLEWKRRDVAGGNPTRELDYVTPSFLSGYNSEFGRQRIRRTYFTIEGSTLKVALLDNTSIGIPLRAEGPAAVTRLRSELAADRATRTPTCSDTLAAAKTFTKTAMTGAAGAREFKLDRGRHR
jgi:hypothetical protein